MVKFNSLNYLWKIVMITNFMLFVGLMLFFDSHPIQAQSNSKARLNTIFMQRATATPTTTVTPAITVSPTATPTNTPVSQASWRVRGTGRIPTRLQETAFLIGGGGPGSFGTHTYLCNNSKTRNGTWAFSSANVTIYTSPEIELIVGGLFNGLYCGYQFDPQTLITVRDPSGKAYNVDIEQESILNSTDSWYYFNFALSIYHMEGTYHVSVSDRSGVTTTTFTLNKFDYLTEVYGGPGFAFRLPPVQLPWAWILPGMAIEIEYREYDPLEFVEVGLYRDTNVPSELEATLLNSWMIQTDQRGRYKEILTVPTDADTGNYYIIATTVRQRKNLPGWVLPSGELSLPLVYGSHTDGIDHYYAALLVVADEPVKVAKEFYEALDAGCVTGDFHHAYSLLSSERKKLRTYEQLKKIYANTTNIEVKNIQLINETSTTATIQALITTLDRENGSSKWYMYDVTYTLVKEKGKWYLDTPVIKEL